jgi:predicted phosphodiesterase
MAAPKKTQLEIIDDLDYAYEKGKNLEINVNVTNDRFIIFSDLHRGNGGGNDDFRKCNEAYVKALHYYLANNYKLILLGDIEELWENFKFSDIYGKYAETYALEKQFYIKNSVGNPFYIRCFGNHDYRYAFEKYVKSDLRIFAQLDGVNVYEGVKMNLEDATGFLTQIYLTHGHQGHYPRSKTTSTSLAVAAFGAVQSMTMVPTNKSVMKEAPLLKGMRKATNGGYLKWAHRKKKIVIYGHTHEAVFNSKRIFNGEMIDAHENDGAKIITSNAYNTGCCSYSDGEITGIEISNSQIKLVKWTSKPANVSPISVINKNGELSEIDINTLLSNL